VSDVGKVRLRLPSSIKAGDVVRVRCLVIHPMERLERDAGGRLVDRKYRFIDKVAVTYRGRMILVLDTTQSVSENPLFVFTFRATEPGPLTVKFHDTHDATYEGTAEVRFS
jgi:thiosulfate oxidation carrier complex protein SoxZ